MVLILYAQKSVKDSLVMQLLTIYCNWWHHILRRKMLLNKVKVTGLLVVVELEALGGSNLLNCEVFSQIKF